ncbi:thymidine kinase [Sediminitomix flava]|uniref:Thymidine kinase n=1 Tax=Sediminitomix flava TaxID=379075 RepID=A0A315Z042_SEDFL|nr:thymidine kinase [Sediminitomix flava]PWJ35998.1 thymidine kinase [Sediminitomix flava]
MFIEPRFGNASKAHTGWIEVVCGSMFSGKTEELIRRIRRAEYAKQKVKIFKPAIDVRYDESDVVSHNKNAVESTPVQHAIEILPLATDFEVIGIDEAQFFDEQIVEVCNTLADQGKRVILSGLDMDFQRNPFGPMPALMASAEYITKLHAVCMSCGEPAQYSYRTAASEDKVLLGEQEAYEARCRKCYLEGEAEKKEKAEKANK